MLRALLLSSLVACGGAPPATAEPAPTEAQPPPPSTPRAAEAEVDASDAVPIADAAAPASDRATDAFVSNTWVMGPLGHSRFTLLTELRDGQPTALLCNGDDIHDCYGYPEEPPVVAIDGRTIRFVADERGEERQVVLELSEELTTITVTSLPVEMATPRHGGALADFRRADAVDAALLAQAADLGTAAVEGQDINYDAIVARYAAIRAGIVAAGQDPFALDERVIFDLDQEVVVEGVDEARACRRAASRRCRAVMQQLTDAVSALLREE